MAFRKHWKFVWLGMVLVALAAMGMPGRLAAARMTTVHVQVNDAQTGDPIYQAHLTLRYMVQGGFMRRSKIISYTGKTDKNGKGQFPVVPLGATITLMVTAPDHNTYGKEFEITKKNQLIEVKLEKPHEVL